MEWYVLRTTFTRRERSPVRFVKEKHAGPFDSVRDAQAVAKRENALSATRNVSYVVGTRGDIGVHGIIT